MTSNHVLNRLPTDSLNDGHSSHFEGVTAQRRPVDHLSRAVLMNLLPYSFAQGRARIVPFSHADAIFQAEMDRELKEMAETDTSY